MYYGEIPELSARKPTGKEDFPFVLLSGDEGTGKSYQAAAFTTSPNISRLYWLELGEGSPDTYLKHFDPTGEKAEILRHNGTWTSMLGQVMAVRERVARPAFEKRELPVVLVIDSGTLLWEQIKDWVDHRARNNKVNRKILEADPDAEIVRPRNLWNDADHRWRTLMTALMTFPGIVIMTCRGKMVSATDDNGNPIQGTREYKVQSNKFIGNDVTVHVALSRDDPPVVIKCKTLSPDLSTRPGVDKPKRFPNFSLDDLIFGKMHCDPHDMQIRDLHEPVLVDEGSYRREAPAAPDTRRPTPTADTTPAGRLKAGRAALAKLAADNGWSLEETAADFHDWTQGKKLGELPATDDSVRLLLEYYRHRQGQATQVNTHAPAGSAA